MSLQDQCSLKILQLGIFVISTTVRCVSRWQEAEFDLEVVELFDAGRNQSEEGWRRGLEIPAVFMQDMNFLQVARPTSSSFSAMSAIELCVQTSSADVSFATQILSVMLPLPVKIQHQDYLIFLYSILIKLYFPPLLCGEVSQQTHFVTWGYNGEASGASGMHRCLNLKTWPRKTGINFLTNWGHRIDLNLTSEAWTKCQSKFQVKESQILQDLS